MACVLCGSLQDLTDEDVIPKWMLRALNVPDDSVTIGIREESEARQQIRKPRRLMLTLNKGVCRNCNTVLLSGLENAIAPILKPMILGSGWVTLDLASQRLLAVWAVKTVYFLELASRQQFPGARPVEGYEASLAELGWLLAQLEKRRPHLFEPPPRSMIWLAAYDCRTSEAVGRDNVVMYAPSRAPVPTRDGGEVVGQFTTLAIGFAAFQVFSVDFVEADTRKATPWNSNPPSSIAAAIPLIWPERTGARDIAWPPQAFPYGGFDRLASWDGVLRGRPAGPA